MRPRPTSPLASDEADAAVRDQCRHVALGRRVRPHGRMHRGSEQHRAAGAQGERREQIVRTPLGQAREHVRRRGRHQHEVALLAERDVRLPLELRIEHLRQDAPARDAGEGGRADELTRAPGEHDVDRRAFGQQRARDLHGLVRGHASGHAQRHVASGDAGPSGREVAGERELRA
jgi:hypothetical protein